MTRQLIATPLSTVRTRRQEWLWRDFVPVGVPTIIAGRGGVGKSTVLGWLTARATRGELEGDFRGRPIGVGFISAEDDTAVTLAPRLIAADADLNLVTDYSRVMTTNEDGEKWHTLPRITEDLIALKAALIEHGTRLLIVDPIASTMDGDSVRASDVRRALDPVAALAAELSIALVAVHHFRKGGSDASDALSGSHVFRDVARSVLLLARDEETDQRILSVDKSNYSPRLRSLAFQVHDEQIATDDGHRTDVGRAALLGESTVTVADIVRRTAEGILGEDSNRVVDLVSGHPDGIGWKDVAAELDLPDSQARTILSRLVKSERICRLARGMYGPFASPSVARASETSDTSDANNYPNASVVTDASLAQGYCPRCKLPASDALRSVGYLHPSCDEADS